MHCYPRGRLLMVAFNTAAERRSGPTANNPPSNILRAGTRSATGGFSGRAVSRSWDTSDSGPMRFLDDRSFPRLQNVVPQLQGMTNIFSRSSTDLDISQG